MTRWRKRSGTIPGAQPVSSSYRHILTRALHHHSCGRLERAQALCTSILRVSPDYVAALVIRAQILLDAQHHDDALVCIKHAIACRPDDRRPLKRLADMSRALKATSELAAVMQQLLVIERNALAAAHSGSSAADNARLRIACVLIDMGELSEAETLLRELCARVPMAAAPHHYLGLCLARTGRSTEAITHFREALRCDPKRHIVHMLLGCELEATSQFDAAIEQYRECIRHRIDEDHARANLSMALLRQGKYFEAWPDFEHRSSRLAQLHLVRTFPCEEWRGQALAGRRMLVITEQGAGDAFQFARYIQVLREHGTTVDVWTAPELTSIFSHCMGVFDVFGHRPPGPYDYWVMLPSLPGAFTTTLTSIPHNIPCFTVDATRAAHWQQRLSADGAVRRVGLVWQGNPRHGRDAYRSLPLARLRPFGDVPGIAWYALQKGEAGEQIDSARRDGWQLHDLGSELNDFCDTAAAIANLDLVVTIDTSVAHLAGSLGKPVWIMLDACPDWRWLCERADSPWYPAARLFRQPAQGDWDPVVATIVRELAA